MEEPRHRTSRVNPTYCFTLHGALKILQTIVNIICVALIGVYTDDGYDNKGTHFTPSHLSFYLISVTFLIHTVLIVCSCFMSNKLSRVLTNSIFDHLYHWTAAMLYLSCSIALLHETSHQREAIFKRRRNGVHSMAAAGVMGLVNTALYLGSSLLAFFVKPT